MVSEMENIQSYAIVPLGTFNEVEIPARPTDGYINATAMCKAMGRKWNHYASLDATRELLAEVSANTGIPAFELIQSRRGQHGGGTWVHRKIAIDLAYWGPKKFAAWVIDKIDTLLTTGQVSIVREHTEVELSRRFNEDLASRLVAVTERIDRTNEFLANHMAAQGYRVEKLETSVNEVRQDIICVREDISGLHQKVDAFVPLRKELSKDTKRRHLDLLHAEGGLCPACMKVPVIDQHARKLDGAEWDHWEGKHVSSVDSTWLVCADCNQSFRSREAKQAVERQFEAYQERRVRFESENKCPLFPVEAEW